MTFSVGVKHEGGHVVLEFEGVDVSGGHSGNRNYPGHPPDVTFDEAFVEHDELERNLDAVTVFEHHDSYFIDHLLKRYSQNYEARKADYADSRRDMLIDEGRL